MIGFHTSEIQLWRAVSGSQKPLNLQIRALSENFKASSSEAWTTWTVGARASLTIWVGVCPIIFLVFNYLAPCISWRDWCCSFLFFSMVFQLPLSCIPFISSGSWDIGVLASRSIVFVLLNIVGEEVWSRRSALL